MAEDWDAVQRDVTAAIRSLGSEEEGHYCTLRMRDAPANDFSDPLIDDFNYQTFYAVVSKRRQYDKDGTVLRTRRMLKVAAEEGVVPEKDHQVAIGIKSGDVDADTPWIEIQEVNPSSPGGVVLYYDIDITR